MESLNRSPDFSLKVNEIFYSLQGESSWTGYPTSFVRLTGCPLRCTYCDSAYAFYQGKLLYFDEIISEVRAHGSNFVCLTGGEPLAQGQSIAFLELLCNSGYNVSLETSGAIDCKKVDSRVLKVIDVKTPGSGESLSFCESNLNLPQDTIDYKFVITDENDFFFAEAFAKDHHLYDRARNVFFSPCHPIMSERGLAELILKHKSRARFQFQLHKHLWGASTRGV